MKYIGMGYMPCNGYVPCQPDHLDSQRQRQRIEGAMPCHNYQENIYNSSTINTSLIPGKRRRTRGVLVK